MSSTAAAIAAFLAHTHHLKTRPTQADKPRMEAPLHPRRLALQRAVSYLSIAQAFDLKGVEAQRRWDKMAALLNSLVKIRTGAVGHPPSSSYAAGNASP